MIVIGLDRRLKTLGRHKIHHIVVIVFLLGLTDSFRHHRS